MLITTGRHRKLLQAAVEREAAAWQMGVDALHTEIGNKEDVIAQKDVEIGNLRGELLAARNEVSRLTGAFVAAKHASSGNIDV